jgi:cell division protein FtsB
MDFPETGQPNFLQRNLRLLLVLVIVLVAAHDLFGAHGFMAMRRTQREMRVLRGQITQLNQENEALAKQVQALKTDPRLIEKIARDEMNLARPGEYIFKILPQTSKPATIPAP